MKKDYRGQLWNICYQATKPIIWSLFGTISNLCTHRQQLASEGIWWAFEPSGPFKHISCCSSCQFHFSSSHHYCSAREPPFSFPRRKLIPKLRSGSRSIRGTVVRVMLWEKRRCRWSIRHVLRPQLTSITAVRFTMSVTRTREAEKSVTMTSATASV